MMSRPYLVAVNHGVTVAPHANRTVEHKCLFKVLAVAHTVVGKAHSVVAVIIYLEP